MISIGSQSLPIVKIHLGISFTGPGKPNGLVGESFTIIDDPLNHGRNDPPFGVTWVESLSQACLSVLAVLRQYYVARLTEDEVRAELLSVADTLRERCTKGESQ